MAKRQPDLSDIFARTDPEEDVLAQPGSTDEADLPASGRTFPTAVGLKESELALLDRLAEELGISRNALMRYGLRYFLKHHRPGSRGREALAAAVEVPKPKKRLRMP